MGVTLGKLAKNLLHHSNHLREQFQVPCICGVTMGIIIDGKEYDIEQEQLELLIERDNPTAWIAEKLLENIDASKVA